jgi:hypothetical protein
MWAAGATPDRHGKREDKDDVASGALVGKAGRREKEGA